MPRSFLVGLLGGLLAAAVAGACQPGAPAPAGLLVSGRAQAGPTCPVEPASPLPGQCQPRAVAGAVLTINEAGRPVASVVTDADGAFSVTLIPGTYTLAAAPVKGLIGGAPAVTFVVPAGGPAPTVVVDYDTGIR